MQGLPLGRNRHNFDTPPQRREVLSIFLSISLSLRDSWVTAGNTGYGVRQFLQRVLSFIWYVCVCVFLCTKTCFYLPMLSVWGEQKIATTVKNCMLGRLANRSNISLSHTHTHTMMAGLWIWALASGVSRKMNPNKTRAASGRHRSSNLSVFFPCLQCEEESAVTQLPVDHRRAMKISTILFSTVDQVSAFVHFYWPVTKQYRISEAEHNCSVLLLVFSDAAFLGYLQTWVWAQTSGLSKSEFHQQALLFSTSATLNQFNFFTSSKTTHAHTWKITWAAQ